SGRILYTSTKVSSVRLGEMSPISFIADLPDVFTPFVAFTTFVRGRSRTTCEGIRESPLLHLSPAATPVAPELRLGPWCWQENWILKVLVAFRLYRDDNGHRW